MTQTRDPRGPAHAMPTSRTVAVPLRFRASSYRTRLMPVPGGRGSFYVVPARMVVCSVCGLEMTPARFAGVSYDECPNPEHPDTYVESANERAGQLDPDPPQAWDVRGRL